MVNFVTVLKTYTCMKRQLTVLLLALILAIPANAQVYKDINRTPKERLNTLLRDIKRGIRKTGDSLNELLGGDGDSDKTLVEVDGVSYMPVYTTNRFTADSTGMYVACRADFARRYSRATVISTVIPQEAWDETVMKDNKKVVMYRRRAWCYVLAKDGEDGYINARYAFVQLRKPGQKWLAPEGYWPKFERADAIPNAHYKKLKKQ